MKENIASFGGNPNQVTINGESAGGSSIELHLLAKNIEGLFHRAIAQSVYRTPLPTPEQQVVSDFSVMIVSWLINVDQLQQPLFDFYTSHAGCGAGSVETRLACLRQASVSSLARAQDAVSTSAL